MTYIKNQALAKLSVDTSTIDWDKLAKVAQVAKIAPTYRVDSDDKMGNGCFGDPPGHPSYFTRNVWTRYGNSPARGPNLVLRAPDKMLYVVRRSGGKDKPKDVNLDALYLPLPVDHPRVQAWIKQTMRHFQHCYKDDHQLAELFEYGKPATIIYPVPDYKLRAFRDDPRFSDEWRTAERAAVFAYNAEIKERYAKVATVDNHAGVRLIREWYPDWTPPSLDPDDLPGQVGDWWNRHAAPPEPGKCPGPFFGPHSDDNCQFCGAGRSES